MGRVRQPVSTVLAPLALACILTAACGAGLESEPAADWWSVSQSSPEELRRTVWENPGTSHWLKWREDGSYAVYHRLGEDCFADTGVVPEYALARPVGEALETAYYDYRNWPQLLQLSQRFERRKELPPVCLKSPRVWEFGELYELVVRAFDQHYAFFVERGVDWSARRKLFEERGRGVSSEDELFSVLEEMFGDFGDGHLNLRLGERSFNAGRPKLRQRLAEHWQRSPRENTESEFVARWHRGVLASVGDLIDGGALRTGAAGALEWGSLGEVGYVRVVRFGGFTEEALSRPEQYAAFEEALKTMKSELESAQAFVVDVALNGGGSDAAALLATSFFADERRPVIAYEEAGSPRRTVFVDPVGKEERPVLLLTSEVTASAAECFAVMMRSLPHVVHVGGTTRGGLSSLLPKPLPEGLLVTLSYQRVLDPSGQSFEGVGVIPDVEVELFPNEDLRGTFAKTLAAMASDPSEWIARAATTPR